MKESRPPDSEKGMREKDPGCERLAACQTRRRGLALTPIHAIDKGGISDKFRAGNTVTEVRSAHEVFERNGLTSGV